MKEYFLFLLGVLIGILLIIFLKSKNEVQPTQYQHPEIKSSADIYYIPLTDSVSDVCYDARFKKMTLIEGYFIQQRCQVDTNRFHFNVKH